MKNDFEARDTLAKDVNSGINDVIEGLIKSQERAKSIVADTNYMLWLEKFSGIYLVFSDDTWLYNPEAISKEDSENVAELCSFFNGLSGYAEKNFLPIYSEDYTTYVCIKFNNIGYEIGLVSGQGTYAYCERISISSDKVFIDFNDVVADKKQPHVDGVDETLTKISSMIEQLLISGVPAAAIYARINDTISKYTKE